MCKNKLLVVVLAAALWTMWLNQLSAGELRTLLEFRQIQDDSVVDEGLSIPRDAVEVFVYEGEPRTVQVGEQYIAVDYGKSGCLFGRATDKLTKRLTVADGWPEKRADAFAPVRRDRSITTDLVGPGVLDRWRDYRSKDSSAEVVASIIFEGKTWNAMQPSKFLRSSGKGMSLKERKGKLGTWTTILEKLNEVSYVEVVRNDGTPLRRYTTEDGLASNIITHLTVADGTLWAACVDIYGREKKAWGPGGLCRFDLDNDRWEKVETIDGHRVRWVTLLQTVRGELWVGFREGSGVEGDKIIYGMGLYPGHYRPKATAIVLACLKDGKWGTFSRAPRQEKSRSGGARSRAVPRRPPTEKPVKIGVTGDQIILFTQTRSIRLSGSWRVKKDGYVSLLNERSGKWRNFDLHGDVDVDQLNDLVYENGEILVTSNRGVHRWDAVAQVWRFLNPHSALKNPNLSAVTEVRDDIWVGYTNQSFGVTGEQGISCFIEETGEWSYMDPDRIGTHCPVKRIVAMRNGEVWVLFAPRQWLGAAMELRYYERENQPMSRGVARFTNGKWEFPARIDGVPLSRERERQGPNGLERWTEKAPIGELATVGNRVFLSNRTGVYMGPGRWKKILPGCEDRAGFLCSGHHIKTSENGKALIIMSPDPKEQQTVLQARFVPPDGEIRFTKVKLESDAWHSLPLRGYLLNMGGERAWRQSWVRVQSSQQGEWVVGPFPCDDYHAVVGTPRAVWIASKGEIVRLDRQKLSGMLANMR